VVASEAWYDAVARACATIEGLRSVSAAGTGGQGATVKEMPRAFGDTPAGILVYRGAEIKVETSGSLRLKHRPELRIYIPQDDLGTAFGELMRFPARVLTALPARAQAYGNLTSLLVTGFGGVEAEQWPAGVEDAPWYIVLPVSLEATETVIVNLQPA
jgi:hypothetical protein